MSCSDYPTASTAKTFKLDAETTNEVVTSQQDRTNPASDGKTKKTFWGIENDATLQRDNIDQLAEQQRENLESTFTAQFAYKRIGNISLYVGDSLPEADKLNSYQYPDDSGEWYGPVQDQAFPIIIPADPSGDDGWALVNSVTSSSTGGLTNYQADNIDDMIAGITIGGEKVSHKVGQVWVIYGAWKVKSTSVPMTISNFDAIDEINIRDFGAVGGVDDDDAINAALEFARDTSGYTTVIVPPSVMGLEYIFKEIKVYSQTTFKGAGGVLKLKDNTVTDIGASYYPINNLGEERVIYDGLIVDGNSDNNPQPVVCDTITCTGFRSKVVNCVLLNAVDSGIMFSGANSAYCKNNYVDNARDLCIYVNSSVSGGLDESIVSNNICKGAPFGGIGIKRLAENCIIEGNAIEDCGNGITIEDFGGGLNPANLQIINNSIRRIGYTHRGANVTERGISISMANNLIVSGNKIRDCSGDCILISNLSDSIISNNHLFGYIASPSINGNNGIIGSTTPTRNVIFECNLIKGVADRGMYFGDPGECQIANNQVESVNSALRINAPGSENIITGNVFYGTGGLDVEIFSGSTAVYKDNILKNGATELAKYGIRTISAGQSFPDVSGFIARFPGEELVHLADTSWWKSYGTGAGEWKRMTT